MVLAPLSTSDGWEGHGERDHAGAFVGRVGNLDCRVAVERHLDRTTASPRRASKHDEAPVAFAVVTPWTENVFVCGHPGIR